MRHLPRPIPALLACFCLALPVGAQEADPAAGANLSAQASAPQSGPVRGLILAWDLYGLGLRAEDPVPMLAAIRLARASTARAAAGWLTEAAEAAPAPDAGPDAAPTGLPRDPSSDEALALALIMAEGDPALADLAADVAADLSRPAAARHRLPSRMARIAPGMTDSYRIVFNGELPAEVGLIGDGSGNLDLTVADATGHRICADETPADRAHCSFTPARNDWFTVTVTNRADAANTYRLFTN